MLDFDFHIHTPRLTISYLNPSNPLHVSFVYDINNTPESLHVNRQLPDLILNHNAARAKIETEVKALEKDGYGQYVVSLRPQGTATSEEEKVPFSDTVNSHDLIGIVSMRYGRLPSGPTLPDVGYSFLAKYQGKGYATEAAQGLLKYAQTLSSRIICILTVLQILY
jgi:RimJ/RimL family protein N-acetyltransferase